MLTFFGISVPSDVYAWIVVVVLPINSALNPLVYTLTTVIRRMVWHIDTIDFIL
jgi:hypothetical protein